MKLNFMMTIATALACNSALADVGQFANASFSNLRLTLVDLRPDDGIAPSVNFQNVYDDGGSDLYNGGIFTATHADNGFGAYGSISGSLSDGSLTIAAAAHSTKSAGEDSGMGFSGETKFTLSPGTLMYIAGKMDAGIRYGSDQNAFASDTGARLGFELFSYTDYYSQTDLTFVDIYGSSQNKSLHSDLSTSFVNSGDVDQLGILRFSVAAVSQANFPVPVPEPTTFTLMLVGAFALTARRQHRAVACR